MGNKYLPIGTICTLKEISKKIMITGYYSLDFKNEIELKDYSGCIYPEGLLLPNEVVSFDNEDIENVDFMGYNDGIEYQKLIEKLSKNDVVEDQFGQDIHENKNEWSLFNNKDITESSFPTFEQYTFDENGFVVTNEKSNEATEFPSFDKYNFNENVEIESNQDITPTTSLNTVTELPTFNQYTFDDNGSVVPVTNDIIENVPESNSSIEFPTFNSYNFNDSESVLPATNENLTSETIELQPETELQPFNQYYFDGNQFVDPTQTKIENDYSEKDAVLDSNASTTTEVTNNIDVPFSKYYFDENGNAVVYDVQTLKNNQTATEVLSNTNTNSNTEVSSNIDVPFSKYYFDENGNAVVYEINNLKDNPVPTEEELNYYEIDEKVLQPEQITFAQNNPSNEYDFNENGELVLVQNMNNEQV